MNIKFISYTGKHPCLCSGVLTLNIDGKIVKFGHDMNDYNYRLDKYEDNNYDKFWMTGGRCGFAKGKAYTNKEEYILLDEALPDIYLPIANELIGIFNDNVPHGCCGGCL